MDIPVFVILQEKLEDILSKAPDWWGTSDKDIYDNLIFVMSPATAEIIAEKIGEPTKELELEMSRNVQSGNTQNLKSSAAPVRLPAAPAPTPGISQAAAPAGCAYRP